MQRELQGSIVAVVQFLIRRLSWVPAVALVTLAGCSTVRPAAESHPAKPAGDPAALTVVAEIALERGDCKEASESYAKAAAVGAASLARRATLVAVACEHLPAAWQSATRWRSLAPADREAAAMYAAVALKLYHIADARAAIGDYWHLTLIDRAKGLGKSEAGKTVDAGKPVRGPEERFADAGGGPARHGTDAGTGAAASGADAGGAAAGGKAGEGSAPGQGADGAGRGADAGGRGGAAGKAARPDLALVELTALLLEHSDAYAVLAAMSGVFDSSSAPVEVLPLMGELALDAYNSQRAEQFARQALDHNANDFAAKRVLARAYVLRGDGAKALAIVREAAHDDAVRGSFEVAEVLTSLDRVEEAHQELEHLRSTNAPSAEIDRRLALLAYQAGDLKEAQQRFTEIAAAGDENDSAMLYLADIAARDGDTDAAIAGYRRLYDSSVALSARSRAASLLLGRKDRTEALTLLDDYAAEHPESEFELTLAKAHLLADHGEAETALALLSSALDRHPHHPSILYDRAVILEQAGRVHESVEALEQLLAERADDPTLLNALGYTLADHNLELTRAESLIRRALQSMPENPAALDSLGWVRFRQGDAKGAAATLERAYAIAHDGEIAAHWGEALWVGGDKQQARAVWASALARDPESQPLKATLARFIVNSH